MKMTGLCVRCKVYTAGVGLNQGTTRCLTDHDAEPDSVREPREDVVYADTDGGDDDGEQSSDDEDDAGGHRLTVLVDRVDSGR